MHYLLCYLGALIVAVLLTPLVIRGARVVGLVDAPGVRKVHEVATPCAGGFVFVLAMLAATLALLRVGGELGEAVRQSRLQVLTMLVAGVGIFLVGVLDDLRNVSGPVKLLALITAAVALCSVGVRLDTIGVRGWFTLHLGLFAWPITVLWIVWVTVGINFMDGLDGLAGGISAIACGAAAVFGLFMGQPVLAVLALALLGGLSGFLLFNFHPARIFMGNGGSMFLGFMVGSITIFGAAVTGTFLGLALPALALGMPILDSIFTVVRRGVIERRSIFRAERGHIHHRLLDMGLHQRHVVIILHAATLIATALGMFMLLTRGINTFVVFLCCLLLWILLFRAVGSVHFQRTLEAVHAIRTITRQARTDRSRFEDAQLRLREVESFQQWWDVLCDAAAALSITQITCDLTRRDGAAHKLAWRNPAPGPRIGRQTVQVTIPFGDRRADSTPFMHLNLYLTDTLEAAGRRIALFGRLLDEHSLAALPRAPDVARPQAAPAAPTPPGLLHSPEPESPRP